MIEESRQAPNPFVWDNPLPLGEQLNQDERTIRDSAHDYAQERQQPRALEAYWEENIDRAIFHELGALGMLGPAILTEYGGAGIGLSATA